MLELSPQSLQAEAAVLQNLPYWVQQPELHLPAMVRSDDRLRVQNGDVLQKPPKDIEQYSFISLRRLPEAERTTNATIKLRRIWACKKMPGLMHTQLQ